MNVKELKKELEKYSDDAEVIIADRDDYCSTIEAISYESDYEYESGTGYKDVKLIIQSVFDINEPLITPNEDMVWKNPDYPWEDCL